MGRLVARLQHEEQAQTTSEYVLLLALVSLMAIFGVKSIASTVSNVYSRATTGFADTHAILKMDDSHQYNVGLNALSTRVNWDDYPINHHKGENAR